MFDFDPNMSVYGNTLGFTRDFSNGQRRERLSAMEIETAAFWLLRPDLLFGQGRRGGCPVVFPYLGMKKL